MATHSDFSCLKKHYFCHIQQFGWVLIIVLHLKVTINNNFHELGALVIVTVAHSISFKITSIDT